MAVKKESRVTATEARVHFGEMMRRAQLGETLVVERNGEPKMIMMSVERLGSLTEREADMDGPEVPEWKRKLDRASQMASRDLAGKRIDWEQIIQDMREERSRQLLGYVGDRMYPRDNDSGGKDHE